MSKEKEIEKAEKLIQAYKNPQQITLWDEDEMAAIEEFLDELRVRVPDLRFIREGNSLIMATTFVKLAVDLYGFMRKFLDKNE